MTPTNIYDYLSQLTMQERRILATELGYSAKYFNFLVTTKAGISELLTIDIHKSAFNKKPSERGSSFTDKMLARSIEELRDTRRAARRKPAGKKKIS